MLRALTLVLCSAVLAASVPAARAANFNDELDIGDKAPTFKDLEGTDGKRHGLGDYKDARVLVIAFTCNTCPVAQAYEERFKRFAKKHRDKGVRFVAINSNTDEPNSLRKMKQRAGEQDYNFDYLRDPEQEVARSYGATVTPHLFVLDQDRKIAYMGAFDDKMDPSKVEYRYLEDAVDALLRGEEPEVAESKQFGCAIPYN